jgi:hypothetical protein
LKLIEVPAELFIKEIKRAILRIKKDNISKSDKISNKIIYLIARYSLEFIIRLFQAYLNQKVHPKVFKKITIVILRKNNNKNYLNLKLYKLIALLNILRSKGGYYKI